MFGELLSKTLKIVTTPIDVANIAMDHLCGGDGSKKSRIDDSPLGLLEEIRDSVAENLEKIDE